MPAPKGNNYAVGNSGGAPEGNQNAVGNAGGGPPDGNSNAVKHGGWSDPEQHYQRLDAGERETVAYWLRNAADYFTRVHGVPPSAADATALGIGASTLDGLDADADVPTRLHRLAVLKQQQHTAEADGWANMSVEREVEFEGPNGEVHTFTEKRANPAIDAGWQLRARIRREEQALGIEIGALARE